MTANMRPPEKTLPPTGFALPLLGFAAAAQRLAAVEVIRRLQSVVESLTMRPCKESESSSPEGPEGSG
jgi:hypothetical protein